MEGLFCCIKSYQILKSIKNMIILEAALFVEAVD